MSNDKKYTPGPWWVEIDETQDAPFANQWPTIHAQTREIIGTEGLYGDIEEDKANANLIAAAPELLEALEACLEWIDSVPNEIILPTMPGVDRDWIDEVIAKAKG